MNKNFRNKFVPLLVLSMALLPVSGWTEKDSLTGSGHSSIIDLPKTPSHFSQLDWLETSTREETSITMISGTSKVLRFKRDISRISISDPEIADVLLLNQKEVLLNAKKPGSVNMIAWDGNDEILTHNLIITPDPRPLEIALNSIDSEEPMQVFPTKDGFVVQGNATTVETQKKIENTAKAFSGQSVSLVTVGEAKQILLAIRFVEIDRSKNFDFGIDGHYIAEKVGFTFLGGGTGAALAGDGITEGLLSAGSSTFGFPALDHSGASPIATFGYQDSSRRLNTFLKALESKTKLRIIAKPNLLVRDGEQASFLVGGEFPVPIVTDNTVNVTYKSFGTRLTYKPEVLQKNRIRLNIETEVSQLDTANSVTVNNFRIPALASRKTTTVTELEDGTSLVIGGLIQQSTTTDDSGTPVLSRIPLIGKLFQSTTRDQSEVELIVIVTPRIIDLKKESFDLSKIEAGSPFQRTFEVEKPAIEDERADVMKETLDQYEKGLIDYQKSFPGNHRDEKSDTKNTKNA